MVWQHLCLPDWQPWWVKREQNDSSPPNRALWEGPSTRTVPILQWGIKTASPIPDFLLGGDTDHKALPSVPKDVDTEWPLSSLHFSGTILSSPSPLPSPESLHCHLLLSPLQQLLNWTPCLYTCILPVHPRWSFQNASPGVSHSWGKPSDGSQGSSSEPSVSQSLPTPPASSPAAPSLSSCTWCSISIVQHGTVPCDPLHLASPWSSWKLKYWRSLCRSLPWAPRPGDWSFSSTLIWCSLNPCSLSQ